MKKSVVILGLGTLVGISACGGSGGVTTADLVGTWRVSATSCNGTPIVIAGFTERLIISESGITDIIDGTSCDATITSTYRLSGSTLLTARTGATCSPTSSCVIPFVSNGNSSSFSCPNDFQALGGSGETITVNGNVATSSTTLDGVTCTITLLKD